MFDMYTSIAIPKTIHDYCEARDKAISLYNTARNIHEEIGKILREAGDVSSPYDCSPRATEETFRKELDRSFWRLAFDKTGLLRYMDAQAKKEFDKDLLERCPEFTIESIKTTLLSVAADAENLFTRGLVNVFLGLSDKHKTNTNEPFKVNNKAVLGWMIEPRYTKGLMVSYRSEAKINDIDRVFKILDGKPHIPRSLEMGINGALIDKKVYEDEYYRVKGFKNGNMHIEFKRQDLLDKANLMIHKFYKGRALA